MPLTASREAWKRGSLCISLHFPVLPNLLIVRGTFFTERSGHRRSRVRVVSWTLVTWPLLLFSIQYVPWPRLMTFAVCGNIIHHLGGRLRGEGCVGPQRVAAASVSLL